MDTWDRDRLWQAIKSERTRLAEDLEGLTDEQWRTTWAWLGEVVVHGMDVRVPLGISSEPDHDAVEQVALSYAAKDWAVNSSSAVEDLELVATDGVFRYGEGPMVSGRTLELVMAMAGRPEFLDRLEGPGVDTLRTRFTRAA